MEKTAKKPLKKWQKVVLFTLLGILAFCLLVFGVERLIFIKFYLHADAEFTIPGSNSGFVAQGFERYGDEEYLLCGYSSSGKASMVYYVTDDKTVKTDLKKQDGSDYLGHTGGIATNGEYVYITGEDGLDVFCLADILNGGEAKCQGTILTNSNPAYCTIFNGILYVGSFYRAGNYETPELERIVTPHGDENKSLLLTFALDSSKPFGVDSSKPLCAYSTTGLVQGMTFKDERTVILSTSYGVATSHLYVYDFAKNETYQTIDFYGNDIKVYFLDSDNLIDTISTPPMSEELVYENGKILILTESASNKYIFGKLTAGYFVYGYEY